MVRVATGWLDLTTLIPSGSKSRGPVDHKHRMETVRPYRFKDAAMLLEDFWAEVDKLLKEKGVI